MQASLKPTDLIPRAGGRVQIDEGTGEVRVIATGLPDIETVNLRAEGYQGVYQAWFIMNQGGNTQKLGVLKKGLDRTYFLNALVGQQAVTKITELLITVEPETGSVKPSENLILRAIKQGTPVV